ncbi:MAG: MBL fold metallo-hydrolase [Candidatus Zixiibacteriota bacterium]|nr:MAG: MBL fold metallo-hydrolase [candidate division Zixibacteria bacterium]
MPLTINKESHMRNAILTVIAASLLICTSAMSAPGEYDIKTTKLADHIYELSFDGGGYTVKVIASVGVDGILLVDTGKKQAAEDLRAKLRTLAPGDPKIIILTHEHAEHLGGNELFGKEPVVIGHSSLRSILKQGAFLYEEFSEATLPDIGLNDSLSVFFNGEEIKVIAVTGSHSGSDLVVWFTKSRDACVAGICNSPFFPSVDEETGDVLKYSSAVQRIIDVLPPDVTIVPGHGTDCTIVELRKFHDMLFKTTEIVRSELAKGKDIATIEKEDALKEWKSFEGSYTSANGWIEYLGRGFRKDPADQRPFPVEPLYYALKAKGLDSALACFQDLQKNRLDKFKFDETTAAYIGYLLFENAKMPESAGFFELSLKEYPDGVYKELCYRNLGIAYEKTGNTSLALKNHRKFLELNPKDSTTAKAIERLEKE